MPLAQTAKMRSGLSRRFHRHRKCIGAFPPGKLGGRGSGMSVLEPTRRANKRGRFWAGESRRVEAVDS